MRILFMGTPEFAIPSLKILLSSEDTDVVGVVTQPDKPKGRGYILTPPPIKILASEYSIPVYQPETLKDCSFNELLKAIDPELIVVVAYGKILPSSVLEYPPYGCLNVHGSLLPQYRGAAPMQRAIIEGAQETGVTTMKMAEGLDTGDVYESFPVSILPNDNFEDIHDKLSVAGANLLLSTIRKLKQGNLVARPQDNTFATYAAKIEKSDCIIDFSQSAQKVHDQIRGLSPMPLAFTFQKNKQLKIIRSTILEKDGIWGKPGEVLSIENGKITVACQAGTLVFHQVLPEGKGRMTAADYINGRKIAVGDILGRR